MRAPEGMMHVVLLGAGLTIVMMGLVLTGWAALDIAAGTDRSLLFAAMVALVGGLILVALAAILSRLRRLAEVIENWPVPRGAAAQALKRAVAGAPAGGAAAPRIADLRPPHTPSAAPGVDRDLSPAPFGAAADAGALPPAPAMRPPSPDLGPPPPPLPPPPVPPPKLARRPEAGTLFADPAMHVVPDEAELPAQGQGLGGGADSSALLLPVLPAAGPQWSAATQDAQPPGMQLPDVMPDGDAPHGEMAHSDAAHGDVPDVTAPQVAAWPRVDAADRINGPEPSTASAPSSVLSSPQPAADARGASAETAMSRPPNARTAWPELRAGERLAVPPVAPPASMAEAAHAGAPEVTIHNVGPTIIKSGVIEGMAYTIYSDGSIEAELPEGLMRFTSIADWRAHMRMGA